MVNAILDAAESGRTHLCLVWPAKLPSLALLHGLATLERNFARDLRGLRTLLYPGTHSSNAGLQSALVSKTQLSNLYRSLWATDSDGRMAPQSCTPSPSFQAALAALNDVRNWHPEFPNPSLGELVPTFILAEPKAGWTTPVSTPLERTLSKVVRLEHRREVRAKVSSEWGAAAKAPGALMVVHNSTRKDAWREGLRAPSLQGSGQPEVLLLDATSAAAKSNYNAVQRIPDFLRCAREHGLQAAGAVIVTDDPKTFFVLRAQLHEMRQAPVAAVWAAEAEDVLLAAAPVADNWAPETRSNSNFSVAIVDRDASQVALLLQKLAQASGNQDSPGFKALLAACIYILRLSNMPAGYADLTALASETSQSDEFSNQRNAWAPVRLQLDEVLATGALNNQRSEVVAAIAKAERLIDAWADATPMATRLLAEVQKHASTGKSQLCIVLPSQKYIDLANRFLQRKLDSKWASVEPHLHWYTLSSVGRAMSGEQRGKHFVFVGINPDVLRILIANPEVPHGTAVLIAYKQADSTLTTLNSMKEIEAFKAYRGRIGLLAIELERRLKEVPHPVVVSKLAERPLTFRLDDDIRQGPGGEQAYYRFELEGGGRTYASGWLFRYEPDQDPFFRRAAASNIQAGDFIFEMSDDLRSKLEACLLPNGEGSSSLVHPVRMLMKLYHSDVQNRCQSLFTSTKRSTLAREIYAKMVQLNPKAIECRPARVYYWLALSNEGDTRPHAPKDARYFKDFCAALDISPENAEHYWKLIRRARLLNQDLGRELATRYAEILFQPESAVSYRRIPEADIKSLQQDALQCVYRVERVVPPSSRTSA